MRVLPPELIRAWQSPSAKLIFLVELDWPSGPVYAWTGIGELKVHGHVWQGVGDLGDIGEISDDAELARSELSLALSVFNTDLLNESFRRDAVGRSGVVYAGCCDDDWQPVEASITPMFAGFIGDVGTKLGDTNSISVVLVTDTADPRRKRPGRYTDASHRREFPRDGFYKRAAETSSRPIYFGSKKDAYPYKNG